MNDVLTLWVIFSPVWKTGWEQTAGTGLCHGKKPEHLIYKLLI